MLKLQAMRKKAGLNQKEIADALNVTQGAVSQWESGETIPATDKLPELAKLLGCKIDDLFKEE